MKICAIICEFNPLHNGHKYLLYKAAESTHADATVCIMSGSFTQRGDICRTDKYLRAKHAIACGADAVIELPAPFAVAPAEVFAQGAIKMLNTINADKVLAFGCESGNKTQFKDAANLLINENEHFKNTLEERLSLGESYIRSYSAAFRACGGDRQLLTSPNNILGVEYVKAILRTNKKINFLPVKRIGGNYDDKELKNDYSSASAIRLHADDEKIKDNMPEYSYEDFISSFDNAERFERFAADWLFTCDKENLKRVYGCTEGLDNRLKNNAACKTYDQIVSSCTNKRYSAARIKRILCANALGLYADETDSFMNSPLPVKVLAIKKNRADELLPLFETSAESEISEKYAKVCDYSYALWRHLSAPLKFENARDKMILV